MIDFRECSYDLDLDLTEHKFIPKINMKQYDSQSRYIKVKLYNKGYEFDITDKDLSFRVIFRKPDGKVVFNTCTVVSGVENYLILPVTSNTLATVGLIATELVIMQGAEIFSSKFFYINCLPSLHSYKGSVESSDEYKGLLESIIKVEELLEEFRNLNSITYLHHVIDVNINTNTLSFANWNEYEENNDLEVYLSGVKQIKDIDYTLDTKNKTITAFGNKSYRIGDQILLCSLRRSHSTEYKDPTILANKVILNAPILGSNNIHDALQNLLIKLNEYLTINKYNQEIADVNDLLTTSKTIVGAINELKVTIDGFIGLPYRKLTETVILNTPSKTIDIPISNYNANSDDLNIYIEGSKMIEGVAYEIIKTSNKITCLNGDWDANVQIYFEVIKSN